MPRCTFKTLNKGPKSWLFPHAFWPPAIRRWRPFPSAGDGATALTADWHQSGNCLAAFGCCQCYRHHGVQHGRQASPVRSWCACVSFITAARRPSRSIHERNHGRHDERGCSGFDWRCAWHHQDRDLHWHFRHHLGCYCGPVFHVRSNLCLWIAISPMPILTCT
jgi:hypothetical protein